MVEIHPSVRNDLDAVFRIFDVRDLFEDLGDTFRGRRGHGDHDKYHRHHHKGGEDAHAVSHEGAQVAGRQLILDDEVRADDGDRQDDRVDRAGHDREVGDHDLFGPDEHVVDVAGRLREPVVFVFLPDISLDHPDRADIFLNGLVERVVLLEDPLKVLCRPAHQQEKDERKENDRDEVDRGDLRTDDEGHDHGDDHGKRRPDQHAQDHLVRVLDICYVRRETCDQPGGRETVDIGE